MRKGGTLTYILGDHLGSTSLVTDAAGIVVSDTKYKAWGDTRFTSGTNPSKYTYTGQYSHTGDFGLMFYNARWYDPSLGRFASADSIVPGGVQGYDRYAYVQNNPLRYTDPSGHMEEDFASEKMTCKNEYYCTKTGILYPRTPRPHASTESHQREKFFVDQLFDPFSGALPNTVDMHDFGTNDMDVATFDKMMADLYEQHQIDLEEIAINRLPNPVTEDVFADWDEAGELGIDNLQARAFHANSKHPPFAIFLNYLGIPSDRENNWMNYESNYLNELMSAHPSVLQRAKNFYLHNFILRLEPQQLNLFIEQGIPYTTD